MTETTEMATDVLVEAFVRFLETGEDPGDVIAADLFADLNVPHWRYQLQGRKAVADLILSEAPDGTSITRGRCERTPTGFVLEAQEQHDDSVGPDTIYRTMWLVESDGERITGAVMYCTGAWDRDTQARHAAEAPMLRP